MKHTYEITLPFNNNEKIIIQSQIPLHEINYCTEASIILIQKNTQLVLAGDSFYNNINNLKTLLTKTLKQELILHSAITKDIGYLFNQYSAIVCGEKLEEPTFITYIQKNNKQYWPGNDYCLWSNSYVTWLYNNSDTSIIFEITPFYPYMYCEPKEEPNYVPYEKWIKTYKPYFIKKIPIKVAQEWLTQTEYILTNVKI